MDESGSHSQLIADFASITGLDTEASADFLKNADWDLNTAMTSYFDASSNNYSSLLSENKSTDPPPPAKVSFPSSKQKSKFATLSTLKSNEDKDPEEGQHFYAGGSQHSGQEIVGPPREGKKGMLEEMMKAARAHALPGGEDDNDDETQPQASKKHGPFGGAGHRLDDSNNIDESTEDTVTKPNEKRKIKKIIKLWENGFSIDDGPLRDYHDSENREFLTSIKENKIPRELEHEARRAGGEIFVDMEDHRDEEFEAPAKPTIVAFSGEGHRLGAPTPNIVFASEIVANIVPSVDPIEVDETKPKTTLQIRLTDGSQLRAQFNHSHTIDDIRKYIIAKQPTYHCIPFSLMTTFPSRVLTDESQTIKDAGLINAVVIQKLI